jgi:hypothetical protein
VAQARRMSLRGVRWDTSPLAAYGLILLSKKWVTLVQSARGEFEK